MIGVLCGDGDDQHRERFAFSALSDIYSVTHNRPTFTTDAHIYLLQRLIPGTKVLAQIVLIRALELVVSLPNQLLAHIPITNISPEYTARLEASGDSSEEEDSSEEDEDSEEEGAKSSGLPGLAALFKEGQWVSAIVAASKSQDSKAQLGGREGDENVRASRRIELSLEPEKVNEGIAKGDLKAGFVSESCMPASARPLTTVCLLRLSLDQSDRSRTMATFSRSVFRPSPPSCLSKRPSAFSLLASKSDSSSLAESRT